MGSYEGRGPQTDKHLPQSPFAGNFSPNLFTTQINAFGSLRIHIETKIKRTLRTTTYLGIFSMMGTVSINMFCPCFKTDRVISSV
jgi:hypothetical protein